LDSLKYRVDVAKHDVPMEVCFKKYDAVFGLANSAGMQNSTACDGRVIGLTTEVESHYFNDIMQRRYQQFFERTGIAANRGRRGMHNGMTCAAYDAIVGIGNEWVINTYTPYLQYKHYIYNSIDPGDIAQHERNYDTATRHFLYMTSKDYILGGLDYLIEIFSNRPNWNLHVCCSMSGDQNFIEWMKQTIKRTKNVHVYGFVRADTKLFQRIVSRCAFAILPQSVGATHYSVLKCMANGLVPIIPESLGIDEYNEFIPIEKITAGCIEEALAHAASLKEGDCLALSQVAYKLIKNKYSHEHLLGRLSRILKGLL
jgi:hypothetical protein